MKLATKKTQNPDGQLYLVSRDLKTMVSVPDIAPSLRYALDYWDKAAPQLESTYQQLNLGLCRQAESFIPDTLTAPLPRATQWLDGSAYVNHVELARKARGAEMPESFWTDPLMYQGISDQLLGPTEPITGKEAWGVDFEAELAVITGDVPQGCPAEEAQQHIRLITLCNDISLRNLVAAELAKGFGFLQSKPASAFGPVAVTPDEIQPHWQDGKLHLPVTVQLNDQPFGSPDCGTDMVFSFHQLIAHAAKTRKLGSGTIIGSGTISNTNKSKGSCCLVEKRMLEIIEFGEAKTPWLKTGDKVNIEIKDHKGESIWGGIEQTVTLD
ncbi:fumarylacetoacetate hydrolase family protein [Endozoicomonas sp. Mp262]|uniref:fumarylacetoacetate hydrolase family protein n=1 Tax=Endozoicomonas sp. Mp262 TaxID=2919499 RepID=UPI0021D8A9DA